MTEHEPITPVAAARARAGDYVETWFSDRPHGCSIVLDVAPYRGHYRQWYSRVLRLSAPRTRRGFLEMAA
jgi:hypothetical protein